MALIFQPHSDYMLERAKKRAFRDNRDLDLKVCIGVKRLDYQLWEDQLGWLKNQYFRSFSWSPFSNEWCRYFAFESVSDMMLFKLTFSGY